MILAVPATPTSGGDGTSRTALAPESLVIRDRVAKPTP
jgi:hypothetical protein